MASLRDVQVQNLANPSSLPFMESSPICQDHNAGKSCFEEVK